MMYALLSPDFRYCDDRGSLTQLVSSGYSQVNVLISKAGVIRGGHYHKICHESFYVISGKVRVQFEKERKSEECIFSAGDFFEIEPYTVHEMFFPEDCIMVALYDRPVETEDEKDIYPYK